MGFKCNRKAPEQDRLIILSNIKVHIPIAFQNYELNHIYGKIKRKQTAKDYIHKEKPKNFCISCVWGYSLSL